MTMRIRLTYSQKDGMRYTGHLDLHRVWERALRRAQLPLAYSQGFHPQPRMNFACALPVGFSSQCELLDVWLEDPRSTDNITKSLSRALPGGLEILSICEIPLQEPALQTQVQVAEYSIKFVEPFDLLSIKNRLAQVLAQPSLPRKWRERDYDLRPLILGLWMIENDSDQAPYLKIRLSAREGANGRPEELLSELGLSLSEVHVHRLELIFKSEMSMVK